MKPRVTVLCAVHNGAPFLRAALDSILSQTLTDFEFLLIDDGSTDASVAILDEYARAEPRVTLLRQANCGLTRTLNTGLRRARGELVARQDADDVSLPERLERQLAFMDRHPRHAVVGCQYERIDESGVRLGLGRVPRRSLPLKMALLRHNAIAHSAAMFRTHAVLAAGGYDETLATAQDYDLWCRLAVDWQLGNLAGFHLQRREHDERIGVKRLEEQVRSRDLIRQRYREAVLRARPPGMSGLLLAAAARWAVRAG